MKRNCDINTNKKYNYNLLISLLKYILINSFEEKNISFSLSFLTEMSFSFDNSYIFSKSSFSFESSNSKSSHKNVNNDFPGELSLIQGNSINEYSENKEYDNVENNFEYYENFYK